MAAFPQRKAQRLRRADGSRKGALDERAVAVVQLLNGRAQFCTTSSCSGRLVLAQGRPADVNGGEIAKGNCTWLMVTHELCGKGDVRPVRPTRMPMVLLKQDQALLRWLEQSAQAWESLWKGSRERCPEKEHTCPWQSQLVLCTMTALQKATGDVVLKFEPFVLHVLCQELRDAQLLHSVAVDSGFRNSGITVGRGGKIMMAVRSSHCLEVPLSHKGKLMVSEEYIEFLVHVANRKMEENIRRIDRFYKSLELALKTAVSAANSPSEEVEKNHSVYVRRRKRKTVKGQDVHPSPQDRNEELEPEDDTESNLDIFAEITI